MTNELTESSDQREQDQLQSAGVVAPLVQTAPTARTVEWTQKPFVKKMWEITLLMEDESGLLVSVYGIEKKQNIESTRLIKTALCLSETLHLWRETIIAQVMSLSREWGKISEEALRETLKLTHVQFDNEQALSAIYFQTACLSGHQVVVEFDANGNPYEAEITG